MEFSTIRLNKITKQLNAKEGGKLIVRECRRMGSLLLALLNILCIYLYICIQTDRLEFFLVMIAQFVLDKKKKKQK